MNFLSAKGELPRDPVNDPSLPKHPSPCYESTPNESDPANFFAENEQSIESQQSYNTRESKNYSPFSEVDSQIVPKDSFRRKMDPQSPLDYDQNVFDDLNEKNQNWRIARSKEKLTSGKSIQKSLTRQQAQNTKLTRKKESVLRRQTAKELSECKANLQLVKRILEDEREECSKITAERNDSFIRFEMERRYWKESMNQLKDELVSLTKEKAIMVGQLSSFKEENSNLFHQIRQSNDNEVKKKISALSSPEMEEVLVNLRGELYISKEMINEEREKKKTA